MSSAAAPESPPGAARSASARVAELFERHGRMVYGICRAMLRDAHDAEDATQQAFLSAHRALLGGARVRDSGAWIATIARNECRSRISAGMRAPLSAPDEDLAEVPHGVDEVERRMQAGELRDALAELPERQREAVVLRYVYGLRYGEVASALGLSRPATEALLFRARRAMRLRLRHAAGTALVVPLAVREELALAIPGFGTQAASGAAAAGVAGGVLAKLASAPAATKLATATVAISTVGAVGVVEADRPVPGVHTDARLSAEPRSPESVFVPSPASDVHGNDDEDPSDDDRSGPGTSRGPSRSEARGGGGRSGGSVEGTSSRDDATESAAGRGSGRTLESDHESGALEDHVAESSGPGSGEHEPDDDGSETATSARSSDTSSASGPGSGEPDGEESEDSGDGSGSSGSGSGEDGSSHSGSDDGDDEIP